MPHLVQVQEKYAEQGLEVVAISADYDRDAEKYRTFVAEQRMDWLNVFDGRGRKTELVTRHGVSRYPTMFLLDAEGKVVADTMQLYNPADMDAAIARALKATPPKNKVTRRAQRAAAALKAAEDLAVKKETVGAIEAFAKVAEKYGGLEVGRKAAARVKELSGAAATPPGAAPNGPR